MIRSTKLLLVSGLFTVIAFFAVPVHASIVVTAGAGNIPGVENVLFNQPGLILFGTTVEGLINSTGFVVSFTSPDTLLASGGQAKIKGYTDPFYKLEIELKDTAASFASLIFNINTSADGSVSISADSVLLGSGYSVSRNGNNYFQIASTGRITLVELISTVGIEDIRQVRIGGAGIPVSTSSTAGGPEQFPEPAPEPASLLLLGSGLAVSGLLGRWRQRP